MKQVNSLLEKSKKSLRKEFYQKRKSLDQIIFDSYQNEIHQSLKTLLNQHFTQNPHSVVHIFLPISRKREIDTWSILRWAREAWPDAKWVVPKIVGGAMLHIPITTDTIFQTSDYGISEPVSDQGMDAQRIDLAITPLLSFDSEGYRLGYGGGFYDRFFAQAPKVRRLGISLFPPVKKLPEVHSFDVPLHQCITPERIWSWDR